MPTLARIVLAAALAATLPFAATSQQADGACIVAGRLADDGHWAPRFEGVERAIDVRPIELGAQHHDRQRLRAHERTDALESVEHGDLEIHEDHVRAAALGEGERLRPVHRRGEELEVRFSSQDRFDVGAHGARVFDEEDPHAATPRSTRSFSTSPRNRPCSKEDFTT